MAKKRKKEKVYWAGFVSDEIDSWPVKWRDDPPVECLAVFKTRREAKKEYIDFRKVKIVEIKQ